MAIWQYLRRLFYPQRSRFHPLTSHINYHFHNIHLLKQALTHRSRLAETGEPSYLSNENLEFLGDAVISLIVSEALYNYLPTSPEGVISKIRAYLVSGHNLSQAALQLHLGDFLILSENEERNGGRDKPSLLENAFEAITGAIYLDGGLKAARKFLHRTLLKDLGQLTHPYLDNNYKSKLQEWAQSKGLTQPKYRLIASWGPDHKKQFEVEVLVNGVPVGRGTGGSKKEAEQNAAHQALLSLELYESAEPLLGTQHFSHSTSSLPQDS